jgi:hypothetical protein
MNKSSKYVGKNGIIENVNKTCTNEEICKINYSS